MFLLIMSCVFFLQINVFFHVFLNTIYSIKILFCQTSYSLLKVKIKFTKYIIIYCRNNLTHNTELI